MTFGLLHLENLNAKVRKDFLINCVLTLRQQFGGRLIYVCDAHESMAIYTSD